MNDVDIVADSADSLTGSAPNGLATAVDRGRPSATSSGLSSGARVGVACTTRAVALVAVLLCAGVGGAHGQPSPSRTPSPTPLASTTPVSGRVSEWRPCPPDQPGLYWTRLADGKCTAVTQLVSSFGWLEAGGNPQCISGSCRCGPFAEPAVLRSRSDAAALASLIPGGLSAWVGLNLTIHATSGSRAWAWSDPGVDYGLADASAWMGGSVPSPASDGCAHLSSSGELIGGSCSTSSSWPSACSIPACPCPSLAACTTAVVGPEGNGFTCVPVNHTRITSFHVFPQSALPGDDTVPAAASVAAGCGAPINGTVRALSGLPTLPLLPGDVLRVCGWFPSGARTRLVSFALGNIRLSPRACEGSLGLSTLLCLEFIIPGSAISALHTSSVRSLSACGRHTCSVRIFIGAALQCWGAQGNGVNSVPPDLPPVLSVVGGTSSVCVLLATSGRGVRCWGYSPGGQTSVPDDLPPASAVAAGSRHTCAVLASDGSVRCWGGDTGAFVPSDLQGVLAMQASAYYTCVIAGVQARAVRCWGRWSTFTDPDGPAKVPADLPPVHQVATGYNHACVLTAGAGAIRCFGPASMAFPPALPPVAALSAGNGFTCAMLASNGTVQCWYAYDRGELGGPTGPQPMVALSSFTGHTCGVEAGSGLVRCWGASDYGQASPPTDVRGENMSAVSPRTLPFALLDDVSSQVLAADVTSVVQFSSMSVDGSSAVVIHLQHAQPNSTVPTPPAFLFTTQSDLKHPVLYVYTQRDASAAPVREVCVLTPLSAYELRCIFTSVTYGAEALVFDGQAFQRVAVCRQPGRPRLLSASVQASLSTVGLPPSTVDTAALSASIGNSTFAGQGPPPRVLLVRPGDGVTVLGSLFGPHAALLQEVPWWNATSPTALRSCIHLSWWGSPAAYHNDSACVCNGQEDWLGEGELPLSAITAWNDTLVSFTVPLGEGIRELRLCVEGFGLDSAVSPPRSSSSVYLAWDPPLLQDMLPSTYVESTDVDADVRLQVATVSDLGISIPVWGVCPSSVVVDAADRAWYRTPLPSNTSFAHLRHCTATSLVEDSLGRCFVSAGCSISSPAWSANLSFPFQCGANLSWSTPAGESLVTVSARTSFLLPLPLPIPNAVLNVTVGLSIWDGGVRIAASPALTTLEFTRSPPLIKSCSPNPLLLGPVGGISTQEGDQATLTLYGVGFRTPAEVQDPRHGLTSRPSSAEVLVAGEPCLNVSVTRSSKRFAVVTCTYPSWAVGGGTLPVTLRMIGVETTLSVDDGSTVALSTQCAAGYYGQFDVAGHQVCRPCPAGGECRGGIGRAPLAQAGFYNMGLPPRAKLNESDAQVRYTSVSAVQGAECPHGSSDGGRDLACVLPCEPQDACLGGNVCAEGYVSVRPVFRCARCAPRYYRSSGVCVPCPVIGLGAVLLLSVALVAACGAMLLLSSNAIRLCTVSTVLEYAQIISLMQGPTLPWPPAVQGALRAFSILRVNVEVSAPECYSSISLTPEAKLWAVVLLPVVVVSLSAAFFVGLALCKRLCLRRRIRHSPGLVAAPGSGGALAALFAGDVWSHGPSCCRTALKLLGMLYLPVLKSSLEVWNCSPTDPSDGKEYLSVVFEECGLPGGLQSRMAPWAIAGLVAYGALYPALLALFFVWNHDLLVLDQLLLAAGTGDDKRSNPRAHLLRQYAAPLYEDYRPGCQYGALLSLARRALVCICALMLNKSPVLQCGAIVFVVAVVLTLQSTFRPLMTPGAGYVAALAQYSSQLQMRPAGRDSKLHGQLTDIAERTRLPKLVELSAGQAVCTDVDSASRPWWTTLAVDWNFLECELQLQVLLTGLLAMMYSAALSSVYASRAVPAVTAMFFLLITVAMCHIAVTVGYDLLLQVRRAVLSFLGPHAPVIASGESSKQDGEAAATLSIPTWRMFLVLCCPCAMSRARARSILVGGRDSKGRGGTHSDTSVQQAGYEPAGVADWLSNPMDMHRPPGVAATCRAVPEPEPHGAPADEGTASPSHGHSSHASAAHSGRTALPPVPTSPRADPVGDPVTLFTANPLLQQEHGQPHPHPHPHAEAGSALTSSSADPAPTGMTLRRARLQSKRASMRLTAIQRSSRFVQVDVEHVITMVEPPVPEDWRVIRSSFIALWELVEFEQRAGEHLRQEVQDLRRESAVTQEEVAALRLLVHQLQAASPSTGPPGQHEEGSSPALHHVVQPVQGTTLSLAVLPPSESSGQYG